MTSAELGIHQMGPKVTVAMSPSPDSRHKRSASHNNVTSIEDRVSTSSVHTSPDTRPHFLKVREAVI
jgi:hypothetical protein